MSISREMLVALCVGVIIISGSFYVSAGNTTVEGEVAALTNQEAPTRQYIETPDSDGDGISDWAEELLQDRELFIEEIDPEKPYAAPTTLTGRFSLRFFQDYLVSKGVGNFSDNKDELVEQAVAILDREATDYVYSYVDITIAPGDSLEYIRSYGNTIAQILMNDEITAGLGEYELVQRAINQNDPSKLERMDEIINSYESYLEATLHTPVPPSLAQEHIDLLNVYNAVLHDIKAMRSVFNDPLLGLLRLKRYPEDIEGLIYVFFQLDRALRTAGVTYEEDEPGYVFNALGAIKEVLR